MSRREHSKQRHRRIASSASFKVLIAEHHERMAAFIWAVNNFGAWGPWSSEGREFFFEKSEDAVRFKLIWS